MIYFDSNPYEERIDGLEYLATIEEESLALIRELTKNIKLIDELSQNHGADNCYTYIREHDISEQVDELYAAFEDMPDDAHRIEEYLNC